MSSLKGPTLKKKKSDHIINPILVAGMCTYYELVSLTPFIRLKRFSKGGKRKEFNYENEKK